MISELWEVVCATPREVEAWIVWKLEAIIVADRDRRRAAPVRFMVLDRVLDANYTRVI